MLTSKALLPEANPPVVVSQPAVPKAPVSRPLIVLAGSETTSIKDREELQNPIRKIALFAGLAFLVVRFSALSELLQYYTGIKFYLLYLFAPLAILGVFVTGGVGRTLRHNSSKYLLAFFAWMVLATPFSTWRGDSVALITDYGRVGIIMLFVTGGLAMRWEEIRQVFSAMAVVAVANLAAAHFLGRFDNEGRLTISATSNMGNSNDLGAELLLVAPFLLFVALDHARNKLLRFSMLPFVLYGLVLVLGTASRGCMIALLFVFFFALMRASPRQRIAALVIGVVLGASVPFLLTGGVLNRLGSVFGGQQDTSETAESAESSAARMYLLKQSLRYTFQHPLFGVGPGQFPNYEGGQSRAEGKQGQWKVTHNFMTQISSECGIPALVLMLSSLVSAMMLVGRTYKQARTRGFTDIANACFCYQLSMIGYVGSIVFLAQAYHPYLPTMIGLAIAMSLVAKQHMSAYPIRNSMNARAQPSY